MDLEPKKFIIDWDKFGRLVDKLSTEILNAYKGQIDTVIGIARGGIPMSMVVADRLGAELDFIRVKSYKGIGIKIEPKVVSDICIDLQNKKVLIIDDLSDQGDTFNFTINYINKKYKPKKINTAALFIKPWSKFKPDVYLESIDKWVVFPWELKEFNILENAGIV
jgi:hypoxanthine phosphoribosyltransferase